MSILFKFMFKNIWEKRLRSLLIIVSVMVATAMCFASLGISKSYSGMVMERMKSKVGEADLIITSKSNNRNIFLDKNKIEKDIKEKELVPILNDEGQLKKGKDLLRVNIRASDISKLNSINKIILSGESKNIDFNNIKHNEVILSKKLSEKLKLNIGNTFKVKINKKEIELKVAAIAVNKGLFSESNGEMNLVMDREGLSKELNIEPSTTTMLVKVHNTRDIKKIKKEYEKKFPYYDFSETISKKSLDKNVKQFTIPFYIMLIVVLIMASFIIFSAYKVIVLERMPVIGTFRSIGATKLSTSAILLMESILYGLIGGILGNILGIPILRHLSDSSNVFKSYGVETVVVIDSLNFLWSFILAMVLSIVSSLLPIIHSSKVSLKNIILGEFSEGTKFKSNYLILGVLLLVWPYIYISKYKWSGNFILSISAAFSIFFSMVFIIPYVMRMVLYILKEIYRLVFQNEGVLALYNVGKSKVLINNTILLCSTLAAVISIYISSSNVNDLIVNAYRNMDYNFKIQGYKDNDIIKELTKKSYIGLFSEEISLKEVELANKDFTIKELLGIEENKFLRFYKNVEIYDYKGTPKKKILEKLHNKKSLIVSDVLEKKENLKIGDNLTLKLHDKYESYKIIGFAKSEIISNGGIVLGDLSSIKNHAGRKVGSSIFVKSLKNYDGLDNKFREDVENYNIVLTNKEDDLKVSKEANGGLMKSLESFSLMSLVIGSLGIMNNLMVSFIYRKRELAVLASIGMSKLKRMKMLIIEAFTIGVIGAILGVLEGVYISTFVEEITYSLNSYISVTVPVKLVTLLGILGFILVIIASLVPIFKSSKISIVEEIKYE